MIKGVFVFEASGPGRLISCTTTFVHLVLKSTFIVFDSRA